MSALPSSGLTTSLVAGALIVLYALFIREVTPLRSIPGPFLASITKLWVFQQQKGLKRPLVDMELRKKYGPIVRIAPTEVMVSSPQSFRTIYGAGSNFRKGTWYEGTSDGGWRGSDNLDFLPEQNMEKYRAQRRAVGPAYTAEAVKEYEENIDGILEKNIGIMHERAGQSVDIDLFLNMFASDCLSTATFSNCKNLVEAGKDDGSIAGIHGAWHVMHIIGYFPLVHRLSTWATNNAKGAILFLRRLGVLLPFIAATDRGGNSSDVGFFAFPIRQVSDRLEHRSKVSPSEQRHPHDIMGKLLQLHSEKAPLKNKDHWITSICLTNFGAGAETIAITVGTLIMNIVSHAGCQERVQREINEARRSGKLSIPPKSREMQEHLQFLDACLRESMRLHGIIGMPLARVVPKGGCELEGRFIPAGTTVGINMWILHRDKSLYGEDAEQWRPERWLEYSPAKLKSLETYNLSFGSGARSCPGKYLAQGIYYKMIPMLFSDFEWRFTNPKAERRIQCTFSVRYIKLMVEWKKHSSV